MKRILAGVAALTALIGCGGLDQAQIVTRHKAHGRDYRIRWTGRDLDLAIVGNGYFVLTMPGGRRAFTRNEKGRFVTDNQNRLVYGSAEYLVQDGTIAIPSGYAQVRIGHDGAVSVEGERERRYKSSGAGQIMLATFADPSKLQNSPDDPLVFFATEASGPPKIQHPGDLGVGYVRQYCLEMQPWEGDPER